MPDAETLVETESISALDFSPPCEALGWDASVCGAKASWIMWYDASCEHKGPYFFCPEHKEFMLEQLAKCWDDTYQYRNGIMFCVRCGAWTTIFNIRVEPLKG
jgi:hypothetical protein